MEDSGCAELLVIRAAFCGVVARWRLRQAEVGAVLGLPRPWSPDHVLPHVLDCDGERRLRMLVRLDRALQRFFDDQCIADWLRIENLAYDGRKPLVAIEDVSLLRGLIRVLEGSDVAGPVKREPDAEGRDHDR